MTRKRRTTDRGWRFEDAQGAELTLSSYGDGQRLIVEIRSAGMMNGVMLTHDEALAFARAILRASGFPLPKKKET